MYTVTLLASYTSPGNISITNVRAAVLRLFTSIFNRNEKYFIKTGVDTPMRRESFPQDLMLSSSNRNYVDSILNIQMFNTFLQERAENSSFFDESIITKNNRLPGGISFSRLEKAQMPTPSTSLCDWNGTINRGNVLTSSLSVG